jgi:23S rRNA (adenine2503-C2)-methyltransferase
VLALQAVTPEDLAREVPALTLREARKIVAMVHRGEPVRPSAAVRRVAADAARAAGWVPELAVDAEVASAIDPFVKYRLRAGDAVFEAVRIPLEAAGRYTVCVSSQVGCALACRFCATGRLGLLRNLAPWEIVEQVRVVRARLPDAARSAGAVPAASSSGGSGSAVAGARVHGVVFQGMGEPMANLDAVLAAIGVMTEPCALGIDARAITVSTAGLPHGIRRLAAAAPKVRLAISLGSFDPAVRAELMPITRAHPLADVLAAAADHARATGLSPMWSMTLLDGVNDALADARALADAAAAFAAATGRRPRLSLIPYNPTGAGDPYRRSPPARERAYRDVLGAAGLAHHKRYSGGGDVAAACGQLAAT